ncbi:MAG: hypothetical protein GXP54_01100 [Deltaproteobacteria bacterium]|nr:hypothetical protein [Deltaproteobacteria bacterium]
MEKVREEFYAQELKDALGEYDAILKQAQTVASEKRKRSKLVGSLLSVLRFQAGEKGTRDLLEKAGLLDMAGPFLDDEPPPPPIAGTVVRRRRGRTKVVDPDAILAKGTRIRMISGKYRGFSGSVASSQARRTLKGLDVTYFLTLNGPRGQKKRTSVKHGTLGKTWEAPNQA